MIKCKQLQDPGSRNITSNDAFIVKKLKDAGTMSIGKTKT
jgi:Asp-tRNA(Asn)/Glu-tRNA(Gln) amidotransferase A subunit family amidase